MEIEKLYVTLALNASKFASGIRGAVGNARNAGLLAVRILATANPALREQMEAFQAGLAEMVAGKDAAIQGRFGDTSRTT